MAAHRHCPHVVDKDGINVALPCPMLDGNLCSIYSSRPQACRDYPYLEEPGFSSKLISVITHTFICPIVFNVLQELKSVVNWRQRERRRGASEKKAGQRSRKPSPVTAG